MLLKAFPTLCFSSYDQHNIFVHIDQTSFPIHPVNFLPSSKIVIFVETTNAKTALVMNGQEAVFEAVPLAISKMLLLF